MGIVTLSLEAPDGAGSREVFYLSLAPEEGLGVRNPEKRAKFETAINRFRNT